MADVSGHAAPMAHNAKFVRRCYPSAKLDTAGIAPFRIMAAETREDGPHDFLLGDGHTEQQAWADAVRSLIKDGW